MNKDELKLAAEYLRGYEDGKAAWDTDDWHLNHERYEVANRLRSIRINGGSHENLNAIAKCIHEPLYGWTVGACEHLRDKLVTLLTGEHYVTPIHAEVHLRSAELIVRNLLLGTITESQAVEDIKALCNNGKDEDDE